MDDDDIGTAGSHILASVSRIRTAKRAAELTVSHVPKNLWGFTYTKFPKPGEPKFLITDEVRLTAWVLFAIGCTTVVGFLVADLGLGRITFHDVYTNDGHGIAVIIAGVFAFFACFLSFMQVRAHWKAWTHPPSQKLVVRILYMVPIYAISAWGSLTFLDLSSYIDFVRGVYEAFVIYTFMILLTKYLGGHNGVVEWMKYKPSQAWPSPMCFLKPVKPDSQYLYYLKYGALQYTILTPICSLAAVVLTTFGAYEDGVIRYDNGYPYVAFILNISQLVSLYCLVWLYVCMKNELMPFGPLYKFLVVKAVVFATFWQGVGLALMAHMGWITQTDNFTVGEVQVGMQDFLVCCEMFIAACVHKYTFGSETYADGSLRTIMEQRALYLAEISYQRAQEAQKEAQKLADALAEAANPALAGTRVAEKEETPEEALARKAAMAAAIRKAMDEDTEGDVLFDEDEVDWTTGYLPSPTSERATRSNAYDYVYQYELEHQRPEGVDEVALAVLEGRALPRNATIPMTDIDFGIPVDEYPQTTDAGSEEYQPAPQDEPQSYVEYNEADIFDAAPVTAKKQKRPASTTNATSNNKTAPRTSAPAGSKPAAAPTPSPPAAAAPRPPPSAAVRTKVSTVQPAAARTPNAGATAAGANGTNGTTPTTAGQPPAAAKKRVSAPPRKAPAPAPSADEENPFDM